MTSTPVDATAPLSVTVPLAPPHASVMADLAQDAGISLPAFCAFVLEWHALHDRPPEIRPTRTWSASLPRNSRMSPSTWGSF